MVHAVYRIPAIPDSVKTRGIARRLRDGSHSVQDTCHTRQGKLEGLD
jgi:hypothetical protein